jgi:hypothetical protein
MLAAFSFLPSMQDSCTKADSSDSLRDSSYLIYYIPFNVETYIPVTKSNIEEKSHYKFNISSKEFILHIKTMLNAMKEGQFLPKRVRLKLVMDSIEYFFDSEGGVEIDRRHFKVDKYELEEIIKKEIPAKIKLTK